MKKSIEIENHDGTLLKVIGNKIIIHNPSDRSGWPLDETITPTKQECIAIISILQQYVDEKD